MRVAIIKVKNCRACPHRDWLLVGDNAFDYCVLLKKRLRNDIDKDVAEFCPLDEVKE